MIQFIVAPWVLIYFWYLRETYLEQGAYWGQGSYFFFEKQQNVKWLISGSLLNRGTYSNYQKKI